MPKPRADFSCKSCALQLDDLPVASVRCPLCGKKRGFKRLFNKVQTNAKGRHIAKHLDRLIQPSHDEHSERKASAKRFAKTLKDADDVMWHKGDAALRQKIDEHQRAPQTMRRGMMAPAAAMAALSPEARGASRTGTYPMLTQRTVVPQYENRRG
jgi:hypothetical protein